LVAGAIWGNLFEIKAVAFVGFGSGGIVQNLTSTALNVLTGVSIGTAAGMTVGVILGRVQVLRAVFEPILLFLGTIPVLILLPFLSLWFGASQVATYGLVIFYTFGTVALGAQQATVNVAGYFEQYARTLGASKPRILIQLIAPAILPEILGAVRVALAFGWGFQTIAEILGGQVGAGKLLRVLAQSSSTTEMIAVVVALGVVAVVFDAILTAFGAWVTRWRD